MPKPLLVLIVALTLSACGGEQGPLVILGDRSTATEPSPTPPTPPAPLAPPASAEPVVASSADVIENDEIVLSVPVENATGAATITDVVLITGQSNALGTETSFDLLLDQPIDGFFAYTDQGWEPASLRQVWDLGWHPGRGGDPHNNFGFHFGKSVAAQSPDRVVGIILATAPGEGISHWDADGFFFRKIRNKTVLALNELPHKAGIDGILWHQGETDWADTGSDDPDLDSFPTNDYYSNRLWDLINNFRLESWYDADRPFICGETARSPVNTRLNALNRDNDIWTACVPGAGLPTYDAEAVHFSAEGLRELGANYADVYLQMTR